MRDDGGCGVCVGVVYPSVVAERGGGGRGRGRLVVIIRLLVISTLIT